MSGWATRTGGWPVQPLRRQSALFRVSTWFDLLRRVTRAASPVQSWIGGNRHFVPNVRCVALHRDRVAAIAAFVGAYLREHPGSGMHATQRHRNRAEVAGRYGEGHGCVSTVAARDNRAALEPFQGVRPKGFIRNRLSARGPCRRPGLAIWPRGPQRSSFASFGAALRFERQVGREQPQHLAHVRGLAKLRQRNAMRRVPLEKMRMVAPLNLHDPSPVRGHDGRQAIRRKYFRSGNRTGLSRCLPE